MEQEENVYQTEQAAQPATAEMGEQGATALGKFKSVNALLEAYGALEAEFTRRSQRLKELERAAENLAKGEAQTQKNGQGNREENPASDDLSEEPKQVERPAVSVPETKSEPENKAQNLSPETLFEAAMQDESVRLKIVGQYLASLGSGGAPLTTSVGCAPALAAPKAKSISDAAGMALELFKK
jgi:hypothetical protein